MNRYLNVLKTAVSGLLLAACSLFYGEALAYCYGSPTDYYCNQQNNEENARNANQDYSQNNNSGGYNSGYSAPVYVPTKPSKYGAVAWNNKNNEFGSSFLQTSSRAAKKQALINCGGGDCKIISTYSNQCVALAWGQKPNGFSFGPIKYNHSLDQAKTEALDACNAEASNCQIYVADCSLP